MLCAQYLTISSEPTVLITALYLAVLNCTADFYFIVVVLLHMYSHDKYINILEPQHTGADQSKVLLNNVLSIVLHCFNVFKYTELYLYLFIQISQPVNNRVQ
jgi:hypothetical protein